MYPAQLFSLFPPFPRENKVFVAMSFDPRFNSRWENVIKPAIEGVEIEGKEMLRAHRVDIRNISDSIMTEILREISGCRLIFADITMLGTHDEYTIRNGNVMYEVGLAHAVRQPEEVILFRSDNKPLLFDVLNIRVNSYNPDGDSEAARQKVSEAVIDALRECDFQKNLAVQRATASLGFDSFWMLMLCSQGRSHPIARSVIDRINYVNYKTSIERLLDAGLITTIIPAFSPESFQQFPEDQTFQNLFSYQLTPFGQAVLHAVSFRLGFNENNIEDWGKALEARNGNQNNNLQAASQKTTEKK